MKLLVQMDEISTINIATDSSFAIMLEAQKRGHEIFYYLPNDLHFDLQKNILTAQVRRIKLVSKVGSHFEIIEKKEENLASFDVILVRQDPPFDMNYITSTYLLEKIKDQVLILNNPSEIRNCPEKIFISHFPQLIAPTMILSDLAKIEEFRKTHGDIILKPLYSCGGDGVFLLKQDDKNIASIFELMTKTYKTPLMVQKFIPAVKEGDKRILLVDGVAKGAVVRMAKTGETRSNLHIGGLAIKTELTKRDLEICETIGEELKKRGLFFVGIDVIGEYLTEINVTSPTCIPEIRELTGFDIAIVVVDEIEKLI